MKKLRSLLILSSSLLFTCAPVEARTLQTLLTTGLTLSTLLLGRNKGQVVSFSHELGGTGDDLLHDVVTITGDNFVAAGETDSYGAGARDGFLVKYDTAGARTWAEAVGGTGDEVFYSLKETGDGGFVVAGYTTSVGAGGKDLLLMKFDSAGAKVWATAVGTAGDDVGRDVEIASDGSFLVVGYSDGFGAGEDGFYVHFTSAGAFDWGKSIGGDASDRLYGAGYTTGDDFVATGFTASFGGGDRDMLFVKFNSAGVLQAVSGYNMFYEEGHNVIVAADGDFTVSGCVWNEAFGYVSLIVRVLDNMQLSWMRAFGKGNIDCAPGLYETSIGNFVVAGSSPQHGALEESMIVAEYASNTDPEFYKVMSGLLSTDLNYGEAVTIDSTGRIIVVGYAVKTSGTYNALLAQFKSSGATDCGTTGTPQVEEDLTQLVELDAFTPTVTDQSLAVTVTDALSSMTVTTGLTPTEDTICSQ